jgi:hypothetical protein
MRIQRVTNATTDSARPLSRRLLEITFGLLVVVAAVFLSKFWIEAGNSQRADSVAFRRSVQMTLEAAGKYGISGAEAELDESVDRKWSRFLATPQRPYLPPHPAHAFVDSFVIRYRDGGLDSVETSELYHQLATFDPVMDEPGRFDE